MKKLLEYAESFLGKGIREIAGSASHPQIKEWLLRTEQLYPTDIPINDSVYAWCGCFAGCVILDKMEELSLPKPPPIFQRASAWMSWGVDAEGAPSPGDIIVLARPGGFHVGFLKGFTAKGVVHVGGNLGDTLKVAEWPQDKIRAIRSPK
jgi:hypothetical protein